jgi:hypothetical protein
MRRYVGIAAGGAAVWAAHTNRYQIELWDTTGVLRSVVVRDAPWFEPWTDEMGFIGRPRITAVRQDAAGFLWVLISIAHPELVQGVSRPGADGLNPFMDTVLEVLDPSGARLMASRRFSRINLRGFWSGELLASAFEGTDGSPHINVFSARVINNPQNPTRR